MLAMMRLQVEASQLLQHLSGEPPDAAVFRGSALPGLPWVEGELYVDDAFGFRGRED